MSVLESITQNRRILKFVDKSVLDLSTHNVWTFFIGKNGSGKSRLLRHIVMHSLKETAFQKVLAISNTQYHRFPIIWEIDELNDINIEKYYCTAYEDSLSSINYYTNRKNERKNSENYRTPEFNENSSILEPEVFDYVYRDLVRWYIQPVKPLLALNNFLFLDSILFNIDKIRNYHLKIIEILNFIGLDSYIELHTKINIFDDDIQKLIIELKNLKNRFYIKDIDFLISTINNINKFQVVSIFTADDDLINYLSILLRLKIIKIKNIKVQKNYEKININDLSSGEKSTLAIMFSLIANIQDNSLICIDEPEINLHPEWQEKIIELLESATSNYKNCHFFIATHSPQIISGIQSTNSFILDLFSNELRKSNTFKNRSSDFQLSEVFNSPGNNNEYLIRKLIIILNKLNTEEKYNLDFDSLNLLDHIRKLIENDKIDKNDKVSILFNLIYSCRG